MCGHAEYMPDWLAIVWLEKDSRNKDGRFESGSWRNWLEGRVSDASASDGHGHGALIWIMLAGLLWDERWEGRDS